MAYYFGDRTNGLDEKDFVVEMKKNLLKHGYVTRAELYKLLGCVVLPCDENVGWTNLDSMDIVKCVDSRYYYVYLADPEALYLNKKRHSGRYPWSVDIQENDNATDLNAEGFLLYASPFESYEEAEKVLNSAKEIIDNCGYITVCTLYDLMGINTEYTYTRIGWTDLYAAYVLKEEHELMPLYFCHVPKPYKIPDEIRNPYTKFGTEKLEENDLVNHPQHYKSKSGLEVIDAIEAFTEDLQGIEAVDTANIIKYICRWKKKNGLQDLEKAQWYLNNLIEYVKENE